LAGAGFEHALALLPAILFRQENAITSADCRLAGIGTQDALQCFFVIVLGAIAHAAVVRFDLVTDGHLADGEWRVSARALLPGMHQLMDDGVDDAALAGISARRV
jgi:hypothetical protein